MIIHYLQDDGSNRYVACDRSIKLPDMSINLDLRMSNVTCDKCLDVKAEQIVSAINVITASIPPPPIPLPSGEGVSNSFFDSDKQRRHWQDIDKENK